MASYNPSDYQPPRPEAYSRQASNASMNRYVPESYGGPSPTQPPIQPPPAGYFEQSRPRGPSLENQQIPSIPPQPNYGPTPGMPTPNGQLHPAAANLPPPQPPYPQTNVDADGYRRAPSNPRRASQASVYSQRSHKSHHSHHSRKSHDSHHSRHNDRSPERRSRESRRSRDERDQELKRTKTHRPSWGDTIFGMFDVIKDALGPRDKYK